MSLKLWKKGESVTGTGRRSVKEAGRENLTGGSMTATETEIGTGIETVIDDATDLAAGTGNEGKNAPGIERGTGIRTGRGIENDETGVEAERGEMTEKTINMIHREMVTMRKSNGFMHLHMLHICM